MSQLTCGHIQHCTPDDGWDCHPKHVKPLRIKNAIVASCWTYCTTINFLRVRKIAKTTTSFFMSVCLSVCLSVCQSARNNLTPTEREFHEISYMSIFGKSVKILQVSLKSETNNGYFTRRPIHILIISGSILLKMRNESDRNCAGYQTTHTMYVQWFFFKSHRLWDNVEKYFRGACACALHAR